MKFEKGQIIIINEDVVRVEQVKKKTLIVYNGVNEWEINKIEVRE